MNYAGKVLISSNALSPFLHFSSLHFSFCNIWIEPTNFAIMSFQCDLQLTLNMEMDWARRMKCALASKSKLESKCLLFLACVEVLRATLKMMTRELSPCMVSYALNMCLCVFKFEFESIYVWFLVCVFWKSKICVCVCSVYLSHCDLCLFVSR
jgi:hypothetical protein